MYILQKHLKRLSQKTPPVSIRKIDQRMLYLHCDGNLNFNNEAYCINALRCWTESECLVQDIYGQMAAVE